MREPVVSQLIYPLLARGRDRLETQTSHQSQQQYVHPLLARGRDRLETLMIDLTVNIYTYFPYSLGDALSQLL